MEDEIIKKLKESMFTSHMDSFRFLQDESMPIGAEYLLTVNAAKAIDELNKDPGTPFTSGVYQIFLEHKTAKLESRCKPRPSRRPLMSKKSWLYPREVYGPGKRVSRRGRVDIAVYKKSRNPIIHDPLCVIECKGFNPVKKYILRDLKRNSELLNLKFTTGVSKLSFTAFMAFHSFRKAINDSDKNKNKEKIKKRYKKYIRHEPILNKVSQDINVFTVEEGYFPRPDDPYVQEYELDGNEDYQLVGVIVISKKSDGL
ncbi:hypothetical protein [Spartinivicinus ruber]|uniref:hypothetical protein n=1 Tax=Spartinivicinus ruber TaxID=2683272 RepID=UPI0013D73BDD|nr:hypothetical protein [Spartinivicinus ruber]